MTARHGDRAEPEYRLPAMIIPAVIGPMGLLTFGLVIAAQKSWAGAAVGYGMEGFGATAAANIIITYAVDAYRPVSPSGCLRIAILLFFLFFARVEADSVVRASLLPKIAGETIVIVFIIRNVIACLISTYISKWFGSQGLRDAFGELVGVAYIILSLSLVLFVFGRKIRRFTTKFGPMVEAAGY